MSNSPISPSHASTGPRGGLSMYDYKNRPTDPGASSSTMYSPDGSELASSQPKPRKTRKVRKTPLRPLALSESSSPREKKAAALPLQRYEVDFVARPAVSRQLPAHSVKNLGQAVEKEIVLWTLEPEDTLLDVQDRWALLLYDLGFAVDDIRKEITSEKTRHALLEVNPRWVWRIHPEARALSDYFPLGRRCIGKSGKELAEAFEWGIDGCNPSDSSAAKALIETATEVLGGDLAAHPATPDVFYARALSKDLSVLKHVPAASRRWDDCKRACEEDASRVWMVPDSLLADSEVLQLATKFATAALDERPELFRHLSDRLKKQPAFVKTVVERNPMVLKDIDPKLFHEKGEYLELCEVAVEREPAALKFVRQDFLTNLLIKSAVQKMPWMVHQIPSCKIDPALWVQLTKFFFTEGEYAQLEKMDDAVFERACRDGLKSGEIDLGEIADYVEICGDRARYSAQRAEDVRKLFIEGIYRDETSAMYVPQKLSQDLAQHFSSNETVLNYLHGTPRRPNKNSCLIS